jgi:peptidyl-prolyl cis-trans isomerase B (cyclophilin B)
MKMKTTFASMALLLVALFSSCAGDKKDQVVTITTPYGEMVVILYDETPEHKKNFLKLVNDKFYDSTLFHRVIQGFMIQGGDPDSKKAQPGQPLGSGGPGYTVPAEINDKLYHEKGALAAARLGDQQNPSKASSGSQFYIVQGTKIAEEEMKIDQQKLNKAMQAMYQTGVHQQLFDSLMLLFNSGDIPAYTAKINSIIPRVEKATGLVVTRDVSPAKVKAYTTIGGVPFLDNQYTVFGKVIKGLEVIDKIAAVQTAGERPMEDVRMSMKVETMSKKKIEKEYGYTYPEVK